jgi:hypothetical protein
MEGIILEAESGDYLGKHRGFWFYTIGQRQGLRLPGGPWYVPSFDAFSTISCPVIIIVSPYCLLLQWGKVFPSSYKLDNTPCVAAGFFSVKKEDS